MSAQVIDADAKGLANGVGQAGRGWVHLHGPVLVHAFRVVDAACLVLALRATAHFLQVPWTHEQVLRSALAVACYMLFASTLVLYRSWRTSTIFAELRRALFCCLGAIGVTMLPSLLMMRADTDAFVMLGSWAGLSAAAILLGRGAIRLTLRNWRASGRNFRKAVIVGADDVARHLARQLKNSPWMGIKLVGVTASLEEYQRIHAQQSPDLVYIALPLHRHRFITEIMRELRDSTTSVYFVPDLSPYGLLRSSWDTIGDTLAVTLVDTPHKGPDGVAKRVVDIVISTLALAGLVIPMAVIAIAVKLTSPGPAIFAQRRCGLDGKVFRIYKFRTMSKVEDGESQFTFTQASRSDRRVTPLGSFLRRTSLDELPQLFNVLRGNMSLVGPRPHPLALNDMHRKLIDGYMLRHKVKPGITGLAQISGCRGETDTPEKMRARVHWDLEYINSWSLWLDIKIMCRTLAMMLRDPTAF